MEKLQFHSKNFEDIKEELSKDKNQKKEIINFFNLHDIYHYKQTKIFRNFLIKEKKNYKNFLDGFLPWFFLNITNLKKVKRQRGPDFTKRFLNDGKLNKNSKHFFLGLGNNELRKLLEKTKLNKKQIENFELPYISELEFQEKDIKNAVKKINYFKPDYIWVSLPCPKQNILAFQILNKINVKKIFAVGAGIDFLLENKKEAPAIFGKIGLEWFYRLVTDFKYSKKKVLNHFKGLFYMINTVRLE